MYKNMKGKRKMTVYEYVNQVKEMEDQFRNKNGTKFSDAMMKDCDIWSKNACLGYFLYALEASSFGGKIKADIRRELLDHLEWHLDIYTLEEAEQYYLDQRGI